MKDIGATNYILGMEIKRDRTKRKLWLNQRKYVKTILQKFSMHDSKPVKVPIPIGVKLSAEQCPKHKTRKRTCPMFHMQVQSIAGCMRWFVLDQTLQMQ